ncbi:MAG TPA: VOC family protein [Solirubrobacterales bacterium]|jgi:catechol 2,3-dioxygenase-like lactoylglutathione lyase family enzyme|nr:VOC family protein [Solirubrobacterales bacterium]
MIDHVSIEVSDFARSKTFYKAALEPLGIRLLMEFESNAGFGKETEQGPKPFFWVDFRGRPAVSGAHVAFGVRTTEQVDAFHAAALAAGGTDNGAPGLRPIYHPGYYGAFVLDPDGNNIEAVCHRAAQ